MLLINFNWIRKANINFLFHFFFSLDYSLNIYTIHFFQTGTLNISNLNTHKKVIITKHPVILINICNKIMRVIMKKYHIPSEIQPLISCSSNPCVFVFQIFFELHTHTDENLNQSLMQRKCHSPSNLKCLNGFLCVFVCILHAEGQFKIMNPC